MGNAIVSNLHPYRRPAPSVREKALAPAPLRFQFGRRSDLEAVKFMASHALDLVPASIEALEVLELLTPGSERLSLRARYEAFLAADAFHPEATRVREVLINLLLEHHHYYRALHHIAALTRPRGQRAPSEEISRACRVSPPAQDPPPPPTEYEELDELDLEACEEWEWSALAFVKAAAE